MSGTWTWTYQDPEGQPMTGERLVQAGFPSQGEAETWLGEQWRDLAEAGVDSVTLRMDGERVYGPMSLRPAQ
ncbi:MAG TPA: hypothetical protein VFJ97_07335 [Dermatophilaceae bacterium]|nr:hypothetical protein [Dermatophilaceae bacterium]